MPELMVYRLLDRMPADAWNFMKSDNHLSADVSELRQIDQPLRLSGQPAFLSIVRYAEQECKSTVKFMNGIKKATLQLPLSVR